MRRQDLGHAHAKGSFGPKEKLREGTYASQKSSLASRNHREIRTFGTLGRELAWGWKVEIWRLIRLSGMALRQEMARADMTQQWDTTVANEEKPSEKARAIRARQRAIGRELRRMYDDVAQEPVPEDFMDLLRQIDESSDDKGGKKVS
jgi:hypothetical protein